MSFYSLIVGIPTPVLIDYGLCMGLWEHNGPHIPFATKWMAPELAVRSCAHGTSDLHSLAIMLGHIGDVLQIQDFQQMAETFGRATCFAQRPTHEEVYAMLTYNLRNISEQ